MFSRLMACALGLACVLAILFIVAVKGKSADFDKDWLLEDLTCEELVSGYKFELEILSQIVESYNDCLAFYENSETSYHGDLHCALIKKEGLFVQGMANDIAGVFNAKSECTGDGK